MEYMVEITEPSQDILETKNATRANPRLREPGVWDDLMMTLIPFLIMCVVVAGVLCLCVLGAKAMEEQSNSRPAVRPADFSQEFYDWCMTNLGGDDNYCYWHSGG
jgi:hypothetical protein